MTTLEQKLIQFISKYPMLYDQDCREYYNNAVKEPVWNDISRQLDEEVPMLKKKWNNLRDAYRKALLKRATRPNEKIRPWKYEQDMKFLIEHFADRKQQLTNLPPVPEPGPDPPPPASNESGGDSSSDEQDEEDEDEDEKPKKRGRPRKNKKVKKEKVTPAAKRRAASIISAAKSKAQLSSWSEAPSKAAAPPEKLDHLSSFFKSSEATVRTFDPILQVEIKSKISSLVCEYEMKNVIISTQSNDKWPTTLPAVLPSPSTLTTTASPISSPAVLPSPNTAQSSFNNSYHSAAQYAMTQFGTNNNCSRPNPDLTPL